MPNTNCFVYGRTITISQRRYQLDRSRLLKIFLQFNRESGLVWDSVYANDAEMFMTFAIEKWMEISMILMSRPL